MGLGDDVVDKIAVDITGSEPDGVQPNHVVGNGAGTGKNGGNHHLQES